MQACALANPSTPIPNSTYTQLINSAKALELLNGELPTIQQISSCGFVDEAFRHIVDDECPDLRTDSNRLAIAALISAITLTITSFYFCICIQYASTMHLLSLWNSMPHCFSMLQRWQAAHVAHYSLCRHPRDGQPHSCAQA